MLIIVALVVVWFFVQGPRRAAQDSEAAQINAQNTIQAAAATTQAAISAALVATEAPAVEAAPTEPPLPSPTAVVVFASDTPTPEPTPDAAKAAAAADDGGADDPSAARTATVAALLTQAAQGYGAGTLVAAGSPTALPTTGFADEVGLPGLLGVAVLMIGVIFLARRLRTNG
jgi:LPXTG-motif cell wall-anchored protein